MTATTNLEMTHISASQSQKEVTMNAALDRIDAILNRGATDRGLNTPPVSPANGDVYILGGTPTGAWTGRANDVAYYLNSAWYFINPNEGLTIWVNDENINYTWDGSVWIKSSVSALDDLSDVAITSLTTNDILQYNGTIFINKQYLDNISRIGINTASDATNKLSVNSSAVLFNHNGSNSQVKVNKNTSGDTASHLFQSTFSGRAEFGLIGDDDFQVKVSADGSTWNQSYVIDKDNGNIDFKKRASHNSGDALFSWEITVSQAELASGASKSLITALSGDSYKVTDIVLSGSGTNFSGGGGNRNLSIQDASGTIIYSVIPAARLQAIIAGWWGIATTLPHPTTTSHLTAATTAGQNLVAVYSGGTTDYTAGSLTLIITAKKVA